MDDDYVLVSGQVIQFNTGEVTQMHTILINDDDNCEKGPNENLFSNIIFNSGIPDILVTLARAAVTIDDMAELKCGMQSRMWCRTRPLFFHFPLGPITVGYDPDSYVTNESAGSVDLTIRVFSHPGGAPRPFSLLVNTEDGTASMSD